MQGKDTLHSFRQFITWWYHQYGRHTLPWRLTTDPYAILVSELMLQQTQVSRVIPKYQAFLDRFPDLVTLKSAKLADVLTLWQGLGYNRRAKYLWQLGQTVVELPNSQTELQKLPGIGPYTAAAIGAFAFNQPVTLVETNVRTVFLYHFFPDQTDISDADLLPLVTASLDQKNPRTWYWALMDYGSHLKATFGNQNRRSKTYAKQSKFTGSLRQVRGEILRILITHGQLPKTKIAKHIRGNSDHFDKALSQLIAEQLVVSQKNTYSLP